MTEAAHQMTSNPLPPATRKPGSVGLRHRRARRHHGRGTAGICPPASAARSSSRARTSFAATRTIRRPTRRRSSTDGSAPAIEGYLDADGYLRLVARIKELINRGGEKISPREIDEVLLAHPAVAEAVCFGVPHGTWGEEGRRRRRPARAGDRSRAPGVLPRAPGRLQAAETDSHHRRPSRAPPPARFSGASWRRRTSTKRRENRHRRRRRDRRLHRRAARQSRGGRRAVRPRDRTFRRCRSAGSRVVSPDGDFEVKPEVTGDLNAIGHADVIVSRRQGARPDGARAAAAPAASARTRSSSARRTASRGGISRATAASWTGCSLERVDPGGAIAAAIEPRRVVGSLAYFSTDIAEPGVIHHTEGNRISFGEPDGTRPRRTRRIAEALIAAGFRCPVTTRFRHEIWVKLLGNVAFNPISALTGGTLEELARHPDVSTVVRELMAETEAVAGAARHRAADLDRSADGRRRKGRRAQDVDAAGFRSRPADGARSHRRRRRRAGRAARTSRCPPTRTVYACAKMLDAKAVRDLNRSAKPKPH